VPVKVKQLQIKPTETKSKAPKGSSVKDLKKLKIPIWYKRNSKSSGRKPLRVQVSPPVPANDKGLASFG
jgi:hypothetical protein